MIKSRRHYRPSTAIKLLLLAFFTIALVMPLFGMFSMMVETDIFKILSGKAFLRALKQSLIVASAGAFFSIFIGGVLAWCTVRTKMRYKSLFAILLLLPMLIPSISHGMGLIILYGNNGIISNFFELQGSIYGFWGIVIGSTMYSFPIAYLMIRDILKYEDGTPYEAGQVLGLSASSQFFKLTLPYMRKPMVGVTFCVFTIIITDYGVPLMIGGKYTTLAVLMYQEVLGMLDFAKGSAIGIIMLIPAVIAFTVDFFNKGKVELSFSSKPVRLRSRPLYDYGALAFCAVISVFILLPILTFVMMSFVRNYPNDMSFSFYNIIYAYNSNVLTYLLNSIFIALVTSMVGVAIATSTAYVTSRMDSILSRFCHLLSILTLAVPGIVLGLGYVLFFNSTFIYGTFAILILVNIMHFFASPYLMAYNTFNKINKNIEAVGDTLGIKRIYILKDVILPQTHLTLVEMFGYFFVNSMVTISAVAFLASFQTKPISLVITMFEAHTLLEASSFVSLLILFTNIIFKIISHFIRKRMVI